MQQREEDSYNLYTLKRNIKTCLGTRDIAGEREGVSSSTLEKTNNKPLSRKGGPRLDNGKKAVMRYGKTRARGGQNLMQVYGETRDRRRGMTTSGREG